VSPFPSFGPSRLAPLLRPLLTSRSNGLATAVTLSGTSEISPGKTIDLRCTTAGSTPPRLDHNGFAAPGPLALLGSASYPVPVRRPAASFPASFTPSSRSDALRFASLAVISSRKDFHLQVNAHAGRTREGRVPAGTRSPVCKRTRTGGPQVKPGHPGLPCAMVLTVSFVLSSGRRAPLPPSPRGCLRRLTPVGVRHLR
jgi:hypothetical protein